MLRRISTGAEQVPMQDVGNIRCNGIDNRWSRNMKDDIKQAMELLWDFKEKLDKLHPGCIEIIEDLLQRPKY